MRVDTTDACSIHADPFGTILGPMLKFGRNMEFVLLEWNYHNVSNVDIPTRRATIYSCSGLIAHSLGLAC